MTDPVNVYGQRTSEMNSPAMIFRMTSAPAWSLRPADPAAVTGASNGRLQDGHRQLQILRLASPGWPLPGQCLGHQLEMGSPPGQACILHAGEPLNDPS